MLKDKAKASRKSKATSRAKAMRRAKVMKVTMPSSSSKDRNSSSKARPRKIGWNAPTTWPRKSAAIIARTPRVT